MSLGFAVARRYTGGGGRASVGRIGIDGRFFTMDGGPFTIIETSEFSLYRRYLDDDPLVTRVLAQRQEIGFNTLRVWLLNRSVVSYRDGDWRARTGTPDDGIHPGRPHFYTRLREFSQLCASYGQCVEFTVFTGAGSLLPGRAAQQQHLDQTADAVRGEGNVLLELVNEGDQYDNAPDPDLIRPPGVIISRGSNGSDSVPPRHDDPWDYELYHSNGLDAFQRKVGHNAMEWADQSGVPCVSNENTRYPDQDDSGVHAYDAAMGAALLCAGSCYHSQAGKLSTLFEEGAELAGAVAWVNGARSVPLDFQRGAYAHRSELEGPDCIRGYSRRLRDGREHVIRIRP